MTKRELVTALENFPDDWPVYLMDNEYGEELLVVVEDGLSPENREYSWINKPHILLGWRD